MVFSDSMFFTVILLAKLEIQTRVICEQILLVGQNDPFGYCVCHDMTINLQQL